jgi:hypothetical protein
MRAMAATVRVKAGNKYVIVAWKISQECRKTFTGSALFSEKGDLFAKAKATWIEIDPDQFESL